MLNNFLFRVKQFAYENRTRLIKWALILVAITLGAWLIYRGVEAIHNARYERKIRAFDAEFKAAETKAKDAEARADVIQRALEIKYAQQHELELRAQIAETKLKNTRASVVIEKENYETIRYLPLPATPVSCASACAELAAVNYKCQ